MTKMRNCDHEVSEFELQSRDYVHFVINTHGEVAKSAGTAEYTDCISAEGYDSTNECIGYDTKQSDGEASVMVELWGMRSNPSLPLLSGSLWPGVVAPDSASCLCVK